MKHLILTIFIFITIKIEFSINQKNVIIKR